MSLNEALLEQAKSTELNTDHSEVKSGGGPRTPEPGTWPARLIGYIEMGTHPQDPYQGKPKDPELEVQLVFEVMGKANMDTFTDEEGNSVTRGRIFRPWPMTMKLNERAKFYKTFKAMDYERGLDNMQRMLNDVFRLTFKEVTKGEKKYVSLESIASPLIEQTDDEGNVTGHKDITSAVPPASYPFQLFSVEQPTFEQWESIFIDGEYERKIKDEEGKDTGEKETVSKNFIQERIMESLDWEGSAMQALLMSLDDDSDSSEALTESKEEAQVPKDKKTKKPAEKAPEEKKEVPKEESSIDEDLAALGL